MGFQMLKCVMNLVDIDYRLYTYGVYKENPKGFKNGFVRQRTLGVRTRLCALYSDAIMVYVKISC